MCHRPFHHLQADAAPLALLAAPGRLARSAIARCACLEGPLKRRRSARRRSIGRARPEALAARACLRLHRCAGPFQPKATVLEPVGTP